MRLLLDWKENLHPHRPFMNKTGNPCCNSNNGKVIKYLKVTAFCTSDYQHINFTQNSRAPNVKIPSLFTEAFASPDQYYFK